MASEAARLVKVIVIDMLPYVGQATPLASILEIAGPMGEKFEWDLINATWCPGSTAVADAGGVTIALDHVTTGAGATTAILAATSIVAGAMAADVPTSLWRGRKGFVAGDHLKITFATDGGLTTPAIGASLTLELEITERSGS